MGTELISTIIVGRFFSFYIPHMHWSLFLSHLSEYLYVSPLQDVCTRNLYIMTVTKYLQNVIEVLDTWMFLKS